MARVGIALAQAGGAFFGQHDAEAVQQRIHRRNQQVNRVGADVDGSDPAQGGSWLRAGGGDGHASSRAGFGATLPLEVGPAGPAVREAEWGPQA